MCGGILPGSSNSLEEGLEIDFHERERKWLENMQTTRSSDSRFQTDAVLLLVLCRLLAYMLEIYCQETLGSVEQITCCKIPAAPSLTAAELSRKTDDWLRNGSKPGNGCQNDYWKTKALSWLASSCLASAHFAPSFLLVPLKSTFSFYLIPGILYRGQIQYLQHLPFKLDNEWWCLDLWVVCTVHLKTFEVFRKEFRVLWLSRVLGLSFMSPSQNALGGPSREMGTGPSLQFCGS